MKNNTIKMSDNVHNFDEYIHKHFTFLTRFLDIISKEQEDIYCKEMYEYAKDNKKTLEGLKIIIEDDVIDKNAGCRPRELYARTWKKINYDKDLIELLFLQVEDMVNSKGFCPEGRTNRCIQIIMLLEK